MTSVEDQEPRTAAVTVELNQPPVAADDMVKTSRDVPVNIPVLTNDTDPNGELPAVIEVGIPQSGTAYANEDGTVTYQPAEGFLGADTFTYVIADQLGETSQGIGDIAGDGQGGRLGGSGRHDHYRPERRPPPARPTRPLPGSR